MEVAEERVGAVVRAQIRLVVHLRVEIPVQHVHQEVVALLVEDLLICEVPSPEGPVECVVFGEPLVRIRHVVEKIRRMPRSEEDARLDVAVDADVRGGIVPAGVALSRFLRRVADHELDPVVDRCLENGGIRQARDVRIDEALRAVVRNAQADGELVVPQGDHTAPGRVQVHQPHVVVVDVAIPLLLLAGGPDLLHVQPSLPVEPRRELLVGDLGLVQVKGRHRDLVNRLFPLQHLPGAGQHARHREAAFRSKGRLAHRFLPL